MEDALPQPSGQAAAAARSLDTGRHAQQTGGSTAGSTGSWRYVPLAELELSVAGLKTQHYSEVTAWFDSLWLELLVYLGVYAFIVVSVDTAMKRYGGRG